MIATAVATSFQSQDPQFLKTDPQFLKSAETPEKQPILRGKNCSWSLKKIFQSGNGCAMCFLQKKWKNSVKFGLSSRSNISLPRIGGHHPVPSLSSLQQRDGYSNVLDLPPSPSVLKDPKYARSNRVLTFFFQNRSQSFYCSSNAPALYNFTYLFLEKPL